MSNQGDEECYEDVELQLEECDDDDDEAISERSEPRLDCEGRKRLLLEYRDLIQQIDDQNKIVDEIKMMICDLTIKECKTREEEKQLKNLQCCLENENLKLQCLLKKATDLQDEDPYRKWAPIPVATTFEEDIMPLGLKCPIKPCPPPKKGPCVPEPQPHGEQMSKDDLNKLVCCLMKQQPKKPCPGEQPDPELIKKIACLLKQQLQQGSDKPDFDKICKQMQRSNASLQGDNNCLQNEVGSKENMIECLQQKIKVMQKELQQLGCERDKMLAAKNSKQKSASDCRPPPPTASALECSINQMQVTIDKLRLEMDCLKKERDAKQQCGQQQQPCGQQQQPCDQQQQPCGQQQQPCGQQQQPCGQKQQPERDCEPKRKSKSAELDELKKNYTRLMAELCTKEAELKDLKERARSSCGGGGGGGSSDDQAELKMLRDKVSDLKEEQEEFKCLIKEQSSQLLEYQNKYLAAQQKVEEQKCILDKLEMNNKKIEDQINLEIQRIKEKFQEKLKELAQLPKLLENEQLKLAQCCKEKEDIENKLRLVCKEVKILKSQIVELSSRPPDQTEHIQELETEIADLEKYIDELKKDKECISQELTKALNDLDTLRSESARIIARTKERAEQQRQLLQDRIDMLEKELAQCRATACLSIADREEVIKEMKGQLGTIAYSFDSAQKQIKALKNHIQFLSQGDCNAIPCGD